MKYLRKNWFARVSAVSVVLICLLGAEVAEAGGDVRDTGFRDTTINDDTLLQSGRMEVMLQSSGLFSRDSSGAEGSDDTEFTSLYINPEVAFGYMVMDALQVRVNAGWLKVSTTSNEVDLQDLNAGMGTVQALYHLELPYGTALYAGAGGGYFYGSTARPGPTENSTISNSTTGFVGQGLAGWLLQPGPRFIIRTGLRVDALFSTETPEAEGADELNSTNIKMMGEFGLGFRF